MWFFNEKNEETIFVRKFTNDSGKTLSWKKSLSVSL